MTGTMNAENNEVLVGSTTDTGPTAATNAASTDAEHDTVRLGLRVGGRDLMIIKANIDSAQSEAEVMKQARREYDLALTDARQKYIPSCLFVEQAVQIGTLETDWAHDVDVEAGRMCHEVVFSQCEPSPALTAAFYRPSRATPFMENYLCATTASMEMKVVVVTLKVRKGSVLALAISALVIAVLAGVVIGVSTRSVQVGISGFVGITVVPSLLLSLLHWVTK